MSEAQLAAQIYTKIEKAAQLGVEGDDGGMQSRALEVVASGLTPLAGVDHRIRQLRYVLGPRLYDRLYRAACIREGLDG